MNFYIIKFLNNMNMLKKLNSPNYGFQYLDKKFQSCSLQDTWNKVDCYKNKAIVVLFRNNTGFLVLRRNIFCIPLSIFIIPLSLPLRRGLAINKTQTWRLHYTIFHWPSCLKENVEYFKMVGQTDICRCRLRYFLSFHPGELIIKKYGNH